MPRPPVLSPRRRRILVWRYGLDGAAPRPYRAVGVLEGAAWGGPPYSRERIRQLVNLGLFTLGFVATDVPTPEDVRAALRRYDAHHDAPAS